MIHGRKAKVIFVHAIVSLKFSLPRKESGPQARRGKSVTSVPRPSKADPPAAKEGDVHAENRRRDSFGLKRLTGDHLFNEIFHSKILRFDVIRYRRNRFLVAQF